MRLGFTLIELLVVIAIIAVLAGLILASAGPLRRQMQRSSTMNAMQAIATAVSVARAEAGGIADPAEHPLTGSKAPRAKFVRAGTATNVTATGEALVGLNSLGELSDAANQGRVLLPDDVYDDDESPMLRGLPRRSLGILGLPRPEITGYRRLAVPTSASAVASTAGFVVTPAGTTADHDQALATILVGEALTNLSASATLWSPPDDTTLDSASRVWTGAFTTTAKRPGSTFKPGGTGAPTPYRIRGRGLYDAWAQELLFERTPAGFRLLSAGPDGYFCIDANGADATKDNLATVPEVR